MLGILSRTGKLTGIAWTAFGGVAACEMAGGGLIGRAWLLSIKYQSNAEQSIKPAMTAINSFRFDNSFMCTNYPVV
jgi:hypothetical protein